MAAADVRTSNPDDRRSYCGVTTARGTACRRPAGWGTSHPGNGWCKLHLGTTKTGVVHAAQIEAIRLGEELDMEPRDALLLTVRKAAMWEAYCARRISELDPDDVVVRHEKVKLEYAPRISYDIENDEITDGGTVVDRTVETSTAAELHLWVREHQKALDQLARLAKVALDAGVEERAIQLAEQLAGDLADLVDGILSDHGITRDKRKPDKIRARLELLQGGKAA